MTASKSSKAQTIMDGQTDKVNIDKMQSYLENLPY